MWSLTESAAGDADQRNTAEHYLARCRAAEESFADIAGPAKPAWRHVVAIVGSSRGGTSLLFDLLRSTGAFHCLPGEHTPLYRLHGLLDADPSDAGDAAVGRRADTDGFLEALARHSRLEQRPDGDRHYREREARRVAAILMRQWPQSKADYQDWLEASRSLVLIDGHASDDDRLRLSVLRERMGIEQLYYDLPDEERLTRNSMGSLGPPPDLAQVIEAPPFIVPARMPEPPADPQAPLLLKASVDAYRIDQLIQLVGEDRLRVIHLTRNPAASVNGLIDGWLSHGFFSYKLPGAEPIRSPGYSHLPWGGSWWNFDLPPGWRSILDRPLPEICTEQWLRAHLAILGVLDKKPVPYLRMRAEDLFDQKTGMPAIAEALNFSEVVSDRPPVYRFVMSTLPPQPGRWRKRSDDLASALSNPAVKDCAIRLGYGGSPDASWT